MTDHNDTLQDRRCRHGKVLCDTCGGDGWGPRQKPSAAPSDGLYLRVRLKCDQNDCKRAPTWWIGPIGQIAWGTFCDEHAQSFARTAGPPSTLHNSPERERICEELEYGLISINDLREILGLLGPGDDSPSMGGKSFLVDAEDAAGGAAGTRGGWVAVSTATLGTSHQKRPSSTSQWMSTEKETE